ncbi:MAG: hypothetical protein V5A24_09310, partial [Haloarculaceae archaeon]
GGLSSPFGGLSSPFGGLSSPFGGLSAGPGAFRMQVSSFTPGTWIRPVGVPVLLGCPSTDRTV